MKPFLIFSTLAASWLMSAEAFAVSVPDFTVQIGQEQTAKMRAWILNFLPPPNHHFNIDAPMQVTAGDGKSNFIKVGATLEHVGYRSSDPQLKEGSQAFASLFLCDNAKQYCIKKTLNFSLAVNSTLTHLDFSKTAKAEDAPKGMNPMATGKKDAHGFWDNNLSAAMAESVRTKKPILVDFYGIWCPPCNLFNETVFPKAQFKAAAKKWVLLKMDADAPGSFELKSHFKVGGYPTILAVQTPISTNLGIGALQEIDRVIGYFPVTEFVVMLDKAYSDRSLSLAEKIGTQKTAYLSSLKQVIQIDLDKKETDSAMTLVEDGHRLAPEDHFFALTRLSLFAKKDPSVLKNSESAKLLGGIWSDREKESPDTLMQLIELLTSHSPQFSKEQLLWGNDILDQLAKEVSPDTLSVPGVELSIADIDSSRADLAEAQNDPALAKKAYEKTAESNERLMKKLGVENSRGLNIEMAYALWKSGQVEEAKAVYEKFIKLYPTEFTFYFAASKMYLDLKELAKARDYAENAVKLAYGDNKLRSEERLIRIMLAQGEKADAAKRGKTFLAGAQAPSSDLFIRTNRYIQSLQKAVDEAEKAKL